MRQRKDRHSNQGASAQGDCYYYKRIALGRGIALYDRDDRNQGNDYR